MLPLPGSHYVLFIFPRPSALSHTLLLLNTSLIHERQRPASGSPTKLLLCWLAPVCSLRVCVPTPASGPASPVPGCSQLSQCLSHQGRLCFPCRVACTFSSCLTTMQPAVCAFCGWHSLNVLLLPGFMVSGLQKGCSPCPGVPPSSLTRLLLRVCRR